MRYLIATMIIILSNACDGASGSAMYDDVECRGASNECALDSDCFVQQCTNSACENGRCVHVPYENGQTCVNESGHSPVFGTCNDCECR